MSQPDRLREVLGKALDAAENGLVWHVDAGLYFAFTVDGQYWVQVAFDGFFGIHKSDRLAAQGKIPADLMPRVRKFLPGLPEPDPEDDWLPF